MKKIILMVLTVLVLTGCISNKEETPPEVTAEVTPVAETPVASEQTTTTPEVTPQATSIAQTTNTPESVQAGIVGNKIIGKFSEEGEYPSTFTFYENGTFDSTINMCEGLVDISGTYTFDGTTIIIDFPNKTDVYIADSRKPFTFVVSGTGFKLAEGSESYSCLYIDEYYPE